MTRMMRLDEFRLMARPLDGTSRSNTPSLD